MKEILSDFICAITLFMIGCVVLAGMTVIMGAGYLMLIDIINNKI